jgi:hypothetical protein
MMMSRCVFILWVLGGWSVLRVEAVLDLHDLLCSPPVTGIPPPAGRGDHKVAGMEAAVVGWIAFLTLERTQVPLSTIGRSEGGS